MTHSFICGETWLTTHAQIYIRRDVTHIFPDSRQCLSCETWHMNECVMSHKCSMHTYIPHDIWMRVSHLRDMTHSFICGETWLTTHAPTYIRRDMTPTFPNQRQCLICGTWHTHSYVVRHDSQLTHRFILGETWLVTHKCSMHTYIPHHIWMRVYQLWDMTHLFICGEIWLTSRVWHMTHTHTHTHTFIRRETASCHIYKCVMSHVWMRHVTHMNASCQT